MMMFSTAPPMKRAPMTQHNAACVSRLTGSSSSKEKPMFLLSASLKGPFSKQGGWTNPWISTGRATARVADIEEEGSGRGYTYHRKNIRTSSYKRA